jgi:hypothetical protein
MNKQHKPSLAALAILAVLGSPSRAQEPAEWSFELTPLAWLAGVEGDGTLGGRHFEFDKGFSDLVDSVELAGGLLLTGQYDRYLVWAQMDYFSTDTDKLDVDEQPRIGSIETDMFLGEFAVGYQVDGWAEGQTFDLLLGARVLNIDTTLFLNAGPEFSGENTLVDPILVVRPNMPVLPSRIRGLSFNPTLAIGGGGDSELVYEMQPQLQYAASDKLSLRLGYRRVGYKFDGDKGNEMDFNLSGLIVGAGITF